MQKYFKKIGFILCAVVTVMMGTTVKAATFYSPSDWKGTGETVEAVSDTVVRLKGDRSHISENNTYEGPYVYSNSKAKLTDTDGITESVNVLFDVDSYEDGAVFYVSNSINYKEKYSDEAMVVAKKTEDRVVVSLNWDNDSLNASISEKGIYTIQWKWYAGKDNKVMLVVSVLKDGKVIDSSDVLERNSALYDSTSGDYKKIETINAEVINNISAGYIWFLGIGHEAGIEVYSKLPEVTVETEVKGKDVTVSKEANKVLKESLEATDDETLKALLETHDATVTLEEKAIEKPTEDLVKKFESTVKGSTVTDYFDLSIVVKVDGEDDHNLTNLNKAITLTVKLPELPAVEKGYTRTYYILREHDGVVEKLDATLSKDGKSISFASDKFSTYAIAYVDEEAVTTPNTGDNIMTFVVEGSVAIIGIVASAICLRKVNE